MTLNKLLFILASLMGAIALMFIPFGEQTVEITYRLDWVWGEVQPATPGWTVTNDLGYEVHLSQGYLVTYSAELIHCNPVTPDATGLLDRFGPGVAYAGHGTGVNPSRLTASYVEDLTHPATVEVETLNVSPQNYCQAHYLIGPAGAETTQNLPSATSMVGRSLFIAGEYRAPDATTSVPFTIEGGFPDGVIGDLQTSDAAPAALTRQAEALTVTIHRDLSTLFDGVDFEQMSATDQARAVLRSLTDGTTVWVAEDKQLRLFRD